MNYKDGTIVKIGDIIIVNGCSGFLKIVDVWNDSKVLAQSCEGGKGTASKGEFDKADPQKVSEFVNSLRDEENDLLNKDYLSGSDFSKIERLRFSIHMLGGKTKEEEAMGR